MICMCYFVSVIFELELTGGCFHFNLNKHKLWVTLLNEFLNPSKIMPLLLFFFFNSCWA